MVYVIFVWFLDGFSLSSLQCNTCKRTGDFASACSKSEVRKWNGFSRWIKNKITASQHVHQFRGAAIVTTSFPNCISQYYVLLFSPFFLCPLTVRIHYYVHQMGAMKHADSFSELDQADVFLCIRYRFLNFFLVCSLARSSIHSFTICKTITWAYCISIFHFSSI